MSTRDPEGVDWETLNDLTAESCTTASAVHKMDSRWQHLAYNLITRSKPVAGVKQTAEKNRLGGHTFYVYVY